MLGVLVHASDQSTQEAEAGGSLQVWGQPGLQSKSRITRTITERNPVSKQNKTKQGHGVSILPVAPFRDKPIPAWKKLSSLWSYSFNVILLFSFIFPEKSRKQTAETCPIHTAAQHWIPTQAVGQMQQVQRGSAQTQISL
jgi:hypothetical protein